MKSSTSPRDLQTLLEAIRASDVVETRVHLLNEIEELHVAEKAEVASLLESLKILWEDFTCLDISQCMLNKTILRIAASYLESDISGCLEFVLGLGIKASIWCGKHLKMTLISTEESPEEEHSGYFYQLLSDFMTFSATSFSAFAKHPIPDGKDLMSMVENFISEQLNLTKDVLMEIKRISSCGPELLKVAHLVLDSAIRLCKVYATPVNWDIYGKEDKNSVGGEETDRVNHIINVMKYTVEKLCQLGILAANDGGSLVSVLNLSWKGVVTLLQLGKGALAVKIDVAGILLTLISLAKESLKCAAETWSNPLNATVSVEEAKRIFLPVKFFLINAVRIITQYPSQAFSVFKEITLTVIMISTFRISLSKHELLKPGSIALAETLEPTSLHLLNSVINSAQLRQDEKFQILDWLFGSESNENSNHIPIHQNRQSLSLGEIFSVTVDRVDKSTQLLPGRFALFLNILKGASDLDDDIILGIVRKLGWLLGAVVDESIYSSVLEIPGSSCSIQGQELVNQSLMYLILHSLKTFMIVVSSTQAWDEMESFLLKNFSHPHYLCYEIITELWCFFFRHADTEVIIDIIDKLCSLLKCMAHPDSVITSGSAVRKIARSICRLVTYGSPFIADQIYSYANNHRGQFMPSFYTALLMEGFPLDCLSEKTRNLAKQRLVANYFDFLGKFDNDLPKVSASEIFGSPVFCLSAALQHHQVSLSDTDTKTLKFLVAVSRKYKICEDDNLKQSYCWLLSETLLIISNLKHLYSSDGIEEVILELQTLFISKPYMLDNQILRCKPSLTFFMGGLGSMEFGDSEDSARNTAVMDLYHMLLRERHWALAHLAISAFGYFAARTSCDQLWRFLPEDAALSFDLETGNVTDQARFMSEMKAFLEKERACSSMKPNPDQYEMLVSESLMLKEVVQKVLNMPVGPSICDPMEIDGEKQANRKRKLPEDITRGVELLQNGLKVMGSGISHWKQIQLGSTDIHDKFLSQFSHLENLIADIVNLAGKSSH